MASQNLSIGSFCMKLHALLYEGIGMRFYNKKHHHPSIPSHMASQNLSIGSFCMKLRALLYEGIGV